MRVLMLLGIVALVTGCGETSLESVCEPGELQACPCIGGGQGVQECGEDRQGWAQCQCAPVGGGSEPGGGASADGGSANTGGQTANGGAPGGGDGGDGGEGGAEGGSEGGK